MDASEPSVSFAHFILSLGTTAAIHFGDLPDPSTGEVGETNLQAAMQAIHLGQVMTNTAEGAASVRVLDRAAENSSKIANEVRETLIMAEYTLKSVNCFFGKESTRVVG